MPARDRRRPGAAALRETQRQRARQLRRHESPHAPKSCPRPSTAAFARERRNPRRGVHRGPRNGMRRDDRRREGVPASAITEIIRRKEFFDYEAKYTAGRSEEITPADIAPEVKAELNRMTLEAYRTCRCSGRRTGGFHRHARRQALFHRAELDPRHECGQHRPQAGPRNGHDPRASCSTSLSTTPAANDRDRRQNRERRPAARMLRLRHRALQGHLLRGGRTPARRSRRTRRRSSKANTRITNPT